MKESHKMMSSIYECDSKNRENNTVIADLDGTLLVQLSSFPYFALIAFDVGGIFRLLLLLLAWPLAWILYHIVSKSAGVCVLIFVTFAGVKVSSIRSAASAVLPKYYSEDLHPETWRVFSSCGRKCVLTANPRIMVEPFLKDYLGVDVVFGTEISSYKGIATGFVASPGVLVGKKKADVVIKAFGIGSMPDIGIGAGKTDYPFMELCKEQYIVPASKGVRPLRQEMLPKPVIFHDGRLVQRPTPLVALLIVVWSPIATVISTMRVFVTAILPVTIFCYTSKVIGCPVTIKGTLPIINKGGKGVIFVCSHRTVLDALFVSSFLDQMPTSVAYSISRFTEFLSPIKTSRLSRDRIKDAELIDKILREGKCLVMFPEGTTCREPYLLRFSSLFAELTDQIVPVAVSVKTSMFYGTTARGYKWLDIFFYGMNPLPRCEVTFLDKLSRDQIEGKSIHEVANYVQELIATSLNYKCTKFTRKDKYRVLAGTDGNVEAKA